MEKSQPAKKLKLSKFDIDNLKPDRRVLLIGKTGTGKSVLLKHIMRYMARYYDLGISVCPSHDTNEELAEILPDSLIYDDVDQLEKILAKVVFHLKKMRESKRRIAFFVILDDCMFDPKVLKYKPIRDIFMNGRHFDIFFINCVQYCMDVTPAIRVNTDYIFALRETNQENREKLWKKFFGGTTFKNFNTIYDACTEDHRCLVLDNVNGSNEFCERVFWYKADSKQPHFLLGNRTCWKMHYMLYKPPKYEQSQECNEFKERLAILNGGSKKKNAPSEDANPKEKPSKKKNLKKKRNVIEDVTYDEVELTDETGPEHFINAAQAAQGIPDTPQGAKMVEEMWTKHEKNVLEKQHLEEQSLSNKLDIKMQMGNPKYQSQQPSISKESVLNKTFKSQSHIPSKQSVLNGTSKQEIKKNPQISKEDIPKPNSLPDSLHIPSTKPPILNQTPKESVHNGTSKPPSLANRAVKFENIQPSSAPLKPQTENKKFTSIQNGPQINKSQPISTYPIQQVNGKNENKPIPINSSKSVLVSKPNSKTIANPTISQSSPLETPNRPTHSPSHGINHLNQKYNKTPVHLALNKKNETQNVPTLVLPMIQKSVYSDLDKTKYIPI